ncbi:MAG: S9 family peptidase, partial [Chitinophagaceae bacterium]|nr:S9 family peptidase [Chitinophagaceae bacterium]
RYDIATVKSELYKKSEVKFDPENYETKQVFFPSKDGAEVSMFITFKKGIKLDGNNPTLLYGYGGFNISLTPAFSVANAVFLENGGVYCVANLRGGGEYGEDWHRGGMLASKQNVFDDFIAAAEFLIAEKYTNPKRLAIRGGSNGGLLVAACMVQRPELFGVAIPQVGVLDMLRYHKFTVGWGWAVEYGSSDKAEQFDYLIKYSPLHNVKKEVCYPATLITTADHDDRVVPAHSFKFAATLQMFNHCPRPSLIRIDSKAGHGAGKPTSKLIDEAADIWSFVFWNMRVQL